MNVRETVLLEDTNQECFVQFVKRHVSSTTGHIFPMAAEGKWIAIHGIHFSGSRDPSIVSKMWRRFTHLLRGIEFIEFARIRSMYIEGVYMEGPADGSKTRLARSEPFTLILIYLTQYGPLKFEMTATCLESEVMEYFEDFITETRRVYTRPVQDERMLTEPPYLKFPEPALEDPLSHWFDWYRACRKMGYKVTLQEVAKQRGYSLSYVKQQHALYRAGREDDL